MRYLKTYKIFEAKLDTRRFPLSDEIRENIRDSFRGLEDMINNPSPQFGVKIGRPKSADIRRRGASENSISVNILPEYGEVKQFPELSYSPTRVDDEFYTELTGSIHQCSGFNGVEVKLVVVAYSNGGESRGPGDIIKHFTSDGSDMYGQRNKRPRIDGLEPFLKETVKDRLRWIKIFFERPSRK